MAAARPDEPQLPDILRPRRPLPAAEQRRQRAAELGGPHRLEAAQPDLAHGGTRRGRRTEAGANTAWSFGCGAGSGMWENGSEWELWANRITCRSVTHPPDEPASFPLPPPAEYAQSWLPET